MVNAGTFSVNNEPPKVNDGAQAVAEGHILPNYNLAWISSPQNMAACAQEQTLYNAGLIAPETHPGNFVPFGGREVGYYVTVNTHVERQFV